MEEFKIQTLIINCSPVPDGATAEIVKIIEESYSGRGDIQSLCLGNMNIKFCTGCKACYTTAKCHIQDDVDSIIERMDIADNIVFVVPSYWAHVPGQLKTFFDRCTPYCDTNEFHTSLKPGKKGYAVALRTGNNSNECLHIIESIAHYCGHMKIRMEDSFYLCGIRSSEDIRARKNEIIENCYQWMNQIT